MAASACKLWISREMVKVAKVRPSFLYATPQSRALRLPAISIASQLLGVACIIDCQIVMLALEEWDGVKPFATTKNILSCYLSLTLRHHPAFDANSFACVRIGLTSGIAGREDSRHVRF
jgi:hypothetical protein